VEVIPLTEEIRHGIFGWIHRHGISKYTFGKTNGGNQTVNIWIAKGGNQTVNIWIVIYVFFGVTNASCGDSWYTKLYH